MENPGTWTDVERTIEKAIADHTKTINRGVASISLPRRIAQMLKDKGLLREDIK